MKTSCYYLLGLIIIISTNVGTAQNRPLIFSYYPSYGHSIDSLGRINRALDSTNEYFDTGKWAIDTVDCYLLQNHINPSLNFVLDTIFTEVSQTINNMGAQIYLAKKYARLTDSISLDSPTKNIIGFGESLFDEDDTTALATTTESQLPEARKISIHGRYYTISSHKYIQLREREWNKSFGQVGDVSNKIFDIRSILIHEIMHLLGFGPHDASQESVMSSSTYNAAPWVHEYKPFNPTFFRLDAIYLRALYPKILPQRPNGNARDLNNAPR